MVIRVLVLMMVLTGCSTVKVDTKFGNDDNDAFVLLATDGLEDTKPWLLRGPSKSNSYGFRQVNLETSEFGENNIRIRVAPRELYNSLLKKPVNFETSVRFASVKVPAGDYALYHVTTNRNNRTRINCYAAGSPVFSVQKGRVNVISFRADGTISSASHAEEVLVAGRRTLEGYPEILAPLSLVNPGTSISFAVQDRPFLGLKCDPTGKFRSGSQVYKYYRE